MNITKVSVAIMSVVFLISIANLMYSISNNNKISAFAAKNDVVPDVPDTTEQNPAPEIGEGAGTSIGQSSAKVTIIEFSDFQCPYCGKFYLETFPKIYSEYIKTGKARFVFRNFPLGFHQYAEKAAEAAECANEQGKFIEYQDELYKNQKALDTESLKRYASDIGLKSEDFTSCLDSGKMKERVDSDVDDGISNGVDGTPAFFINGQKLVGAQPFGAFQDIIEKELSK